MSDLEITPVDPSDEAAVAAWLEVIAVADRYEVGDAATVWALPELLVSLQNPGKARRALLFAGRLDGEVVAAGNLGLPLLDNTSSAEVYVAVRPDVRRRGLGSQVLAQVEAAARENGRSRFDAEAAWPYDAAADGAGTAGVEFARRHGYAFGLGDVQRAVALPIDSALLDDLAAETAPHHPAYELRSWVGSVPDDLVQSWLELSSTLMTEAPMGDREYEDEAVDVEAFRFGEDILARQGRTRFHTVALDGTGRVVAYTDLVVPSHDPSWVYQWGTLVRRDHRGHRLGTAVKVANLQSLQSGHPAADLAGRRLVTWNAEVNDHMIGINERLGFRPISRLGELQKKLA